MKKLDKAGEIGLLLSLVIQVPIGILPKRSLNNELKWDRAERHDLKSGLWLFFTPFLFLPEKRGKKKWEWKAKIVILSHAFLLDLTLAHHLVIALAILQKQKLSFLTSLLLFLYVYIDGFFSLLLPNGYGCCSFSL